MAWAVGGLGIGGKGCWRAKADRPSPAVMASEPIPESWQPVLEPVLATAEARQLGGFLIAEEQAGKQIYPPRGCRLKALEQGLRTASKSSTPVKIYPIGARNVTPRILSNRGSSLGIHFGTKNWNKKLQVR